MRKTSQNYKLIQHLMKAGRITQRQAMADYSVQSLTKRISELRNLGYEIMGHWKRHPVTGQDYMEYSLGVRV